VGGSTRGMLSRSVGQTKRKQKYGGLFAFPMKNQLKTSSNRKRKYGRFAHAQYTRYVMADRAVVLCAPLCFIANRIGNTEVKVF